MRLVRSVVALALAASVASATDPLSQANEAFRNGEYAKAAGLYEVAADLESRPAQRAEIRVKLAWTQFALQHRDEAEAALAAALTDNPSLALSPDYFPDEFLTLLKRVQQRALQSDAVAPSGRTFNGELLASLRARSERAADPAAIEALLAEVQETEAGAPAALLPEVLDVRATLLERLGRNEDALESQGRAAALRAAILAGSGGSAAPYETLLAARRLTANGQPADAAALMRGVLAAQPTCAPALEVLGEAYLAAGRYDDSRAAIRTALLAGERPDLLVTLGEVELRRANPTGAREAFRRAAEIDHRNERALAALGLLAASMGDGPAARAALERAIAINGTLVEAQIVQAQLALTDGDFPAALRLAQRASQVRPDDPWVRGWLGVATLAAGEAQNAVELLTGLTGPPVFAAARAEALRRLGRAHEALEALTATPRSVDTALIAARCHLDLHQPAAALDSLAASLQQSPDDGRLRYMSAAASAALGERRRAAAELTSARELRGAPPFLAAALANLEAAVAAEELMRSAQEVLPTATRR